MSPPFRDYDSCGPYGGIDSIGVEAAQGALVREFSRTSSTSSTSTIVDNEGQVLRRVEVRGMRQGSNSAPLLCSHWETNWRRSREISHVWTESLADSRIATCTATNQKVEAK